MSTTQRIKDEWNSLYEEGKTPWNDLPVSEMADALDTFKIALRKIDRVLVIGCGSARNVSEVLDQNAALDLPQIHLDLLDISDVAIAEAKRTFGRRLKGANVQYHVADALEELHKTKLRGTYELVIDWMCLHEIDQGGYGDYLSFVRSVSSRFYILRVFCNDLANKIRVSQHPLSPHITKKAFSVNHIQSLFGRDFHVLRTLGDREQLMPEEPDGGRAAKRTYLMLRKQG